MCRSNFAFLVSLILVGAFAIQAKAQDAGNPSTLAKVPVIVENRIISLSYISWSEFVDLDNGILKDQAFASFYGNSLAIEKESFWGHRYGSAYEAALLFGQANVGGTQSAITYQTSYQKWWGLAATYRFAYRLSPQITLSAGPLLLARQITWPDMGTSVDVKSGAQINAGAIVDLRMRLNRTWEMRQTIGTLALKASTLWSLGFGYNY